MRRHFKKTFIFYFIYLTVPGLTFGMWDFLYAACERELQHVTSSSPTRDGT